MTTTMRSATATALILIVAAVPAAAQRAPAGRVYDTATVATVDGTVVRVDTVAARRGAEGGVHVQLRTATETIAVHVGPAWYLDAQPTKLAPGDRLTVRGSRVTYGGEPAIVAATIRKGAAQLTLRDPAGLPAWSAGAARRPPPRGKP